MFLVDTHTHLYAPEFDEDRREVIERAKAAGVEAFFLPAIDSGSHERLWNLAESDPEYFYPMAGLHPCSVKADNADELAAVEATLKERRVYAVGEIGLDYYWSTDYKEQQIEAFRQQIQLAIKYDLPIVIHARESLEDIYDILKEANAPKLRGIMHCFTGTVEQGKQFIELGFYLGIGGVVTYKNSGLDETTAELPLERLVLETDSPYLAPAPKRGNRNESSYLQHIVGKLAEVHNRPVEHIAEITSANAFRIFDRAADEAKLDIR